ncbi:MAG: hypothetical protein KAW92_10520 [Candidatus Cloacimonetes bacterium]|nr:hypothetical protein [Candidatus Cloacimonadota bacterium]
MNTLCIIPCGSKKIWDKNSDIGPTKAKDVYIGVFAQKCRDWAKLFYPNTWCILSAKYGFLFPNDIVPGPYNVSFKNVDLNQITIHELRKQVEEKNLNEYDQIVVLGGKFYVDKIKRLFKNAEIITPLAGCKGIGYIISKLKTEIDKETLRKEA